MDVSDLSDNLEKLQNIEDKIVKEYNFIRECYRFKFPELENLIHHPVEYVRLVKMIGNETDMDRVSHLNDVLSSAMIMVVSVTASTTCGTPLPEDILKRTLEACDRVIELDSIRIKYLKFVESRMLDIAPNVSALVGSATVAKLIADAGGLVELANLPACNVKLVGAQKKNLAGFSSDQLRIGYIEQTEVFHSTLGDGLGVGYGMFGQDGCGKLRVSATPTRLKLSKTYKSKLAS
ncbi:U4/U6 small nuclear ribonucleoprotein Prp31 homolog [Chenopodium quinoa]|uniref:U4/U6 small nuclear ribonucleoprotein Prp31 homolog n=1 Tax=Chenopodium quinoa TaxID=63459 RepID=UPI000B770FA7|nr:U4/U6 small nuclear ribonucleoprotein Prp31 homolog [Chenopodium quinoa]